MSKKRLGAVVLLVYGGQLAGRLLAQVADPTKPDRGIAPMVSYAVSQFETINPGNGNLVYQFPITTMPPEPGRVAAGLALNYNSTIYDVQLDTESWPSGNGTYTNKLTSRLVASNTGGGWQYSYQYGLLEETIPYKNCGSTALVERFSVVFPDGSRHILQLYNNGIPNDTDGGSPYQPNGQLACTGYVFQPITSGYLTYFTTDGTFIKVVTQAANDYWTNLLWTMYLPDGTIVDGFGSAAGSIRDAHGNRVWFNNFDPAVNSQTPETVIGDSFGRIITVNRFTTSQGFEDIIWQTGYMGANSAWWTVNWGTSTVSLSNQYECTADKDICFGAPGGVPLNTIVVKSINVATTGNSSVAYSFWYDDQGADGNGQGWGEVKQVTLPSFTGETQAAVNYAYQLSLGFKQYGTLLYNPVTRKEVDWQEEYDGQKAAGPPDVWTYQYSPYPYPHVVTAPDGGTTQYYYPNSPTLGSLAYRIIYPDSSETDRTWYQNYPLLNAGGAAPVNPYVRTETKLFGPAPIATRAYSVDKNGNQTMLTEIWGPTVIRTTSSAYSVTTADGGNATTPADEPNAYWNPSSPLFRKLLTRQMLTPNAGTGTVHELAYSPAGDLTDEWRWNSFYTLTTPLTPANAVYVHRDYSAQGNLVGETDGRSIHTAYTYDSNDLYLTQKTVGGIVQHRYFFDLTSGLLNSDWDANNVQNVRNYDGYNRLISLNEASNASPSRASNTSYEDGNRRTVATDGGGRVTIVEHDQLRRVALNRQVESPGIQGVDDSSAGIKVQTRYRNVNVPGTDQHGYRLVSNPYRASTSAGASAESTMGWTLYKLDNMGRVIRSETFSGTALPAPWGSNSASTGFTTYSYSASSSGYTTTETDQAGVSRVMTYDGFGRLAQVTEVGIVPPNGTDATTVYNYDGLDNLVSVTQSGQTRSFTYDSLGRLIKAVNGERGTTCYTYDNDGNMVSRVQGAASNCANGVGILTSFSYDYLNRLTSTVMPEGTVTYTYDQGAYGMGRLYSVNYGISLTTYSVHDPLGRVTVHTQTTDGQPYTFGYSYNGSDYVTSINYPSGRLVTNSYDTAGRVNSVSAGAKTFASQVQYAAQGAVASFQMGNGLWETTNFNSRLQAQQISLGSCAQTLGVGSPACSQDEWWLQNVYSVAGIQNNGNILQQTIGLPGGVQIPEAYSYDRANRLLVASEQSSNPNNPPCPDTGYARYCEGFAYDVWGNRTVAHLTGLGQSTLAPSSFDPNTNRISPNAGWLYESTGRGNIVQEPSIGSYRMYLYDSENRQVAYCTQDPNGCVNADGPGRTRYLYDGDGRRVEKRDSTGVTTYVYDAFGNLAAEYSTEAAGAGSTTEYLTADQLGSTRVVTGGTAGAATVVARHDYRPFGEEIIPSGSDPRVNVAGYATSAGITVEFTGKERDAETGLDYFNTRYFSSAQGRYTSPDPLMASASPRNPQTWNRYAYGLNNPLRFIDPDGMKEISVEDCQKDSKCTVVAVNVIMDKNANNGNGLTASQMKDFNKVLQGAKDDLGNGNIALQVSYTSGEVTDSGVSGLSSSAANIFLSSYVPTSVTGNAMVSGELNGATVPDPRTHGDVMFISANNAHDQYLAGPGLPWVGSLTNTITHEFLHNLSGDTSRRGDNGFTTGWHEFQIDRQASGLHLDINYIRPEQMQRAKTYSPPVHPDAVKPGK